MPCDGGYMSELRLPNMCGLFKPGHNPHWIQMNLAVEDKENLPTPGRFIESRPDGSVVIEVDGQEVHLWNHEPERLAEAAPVLRILAIMDLKRMVVPGTLFSKPENDA